MKVCRYYFLYITQISDLFDPSRCYYFTRISLEKTTLFNQSNENLSGLWKVFEYKPQLNLKLGSHMNKTEEFLKYQIKELIIGN